MDQRNCEPSRVGQAGQGGIGHDRDGGSGGADDSRPTGQSGTGQTDRGDAGDPKDYDSDPQGGGGRLDQVKPDPLPAEGGDAPSHGSR